jgi:PAS domain S-box-containing protein
MYATVKVHQHEKELSIRLQRADAGLLNDQIVQAFLENFREATNKRQAEGKIWFQATLLDQIPKSVIATDLNFNLVYWNKFAEGLYGWKEEEVLGNNALELLLPERSKEAVQRSLDYVRRNGQWKGEITFRKKDGGTFPGEVSCAAIKDLNDSFIGYVAISGDKSERKQAEEKLLLQTTYFRQLFENSPEGIVLVDESDCVINVNAAFEEMFQYPLEVLKEHPVNNFIVPSDRLEEAKKVTLDSTEGRIVRQNSVRKRKDDTLVDVIITALPIIIRNQRVGSYGIYVDISESKRLESQLVRAQRLESLGTLAGGIAHDFNNILGIIMGHVSLLHRFQGNQNQFQESVGAINRALQRAVGVAKQLLTFARKTEVLFKSVVINDVVAEIASLLHETFPKRITITLDLEKNLPLIDADASQIDQVLMNLCLNSRDAMPSGGTLCFMTRLVTGASIRGSWIRAEAIEYIQLVVSDTGIGMDEDTKSHIFEPFFTTKERDKGTGLGLAVVFGIVRGHDGFVSVQSEKGLGTSFSIYLPVKSRVVDYSDQEQEITTDDGAGTETLLIVEDEEMLRELVKVSLLGKGYKVLAAADGAEAVEIYQQHSSEIDLVLCDLGLPKLDGYEVLRRLKEINPSPKFILATGYIEPELKSEILKAGAEEIIQKPYVSHKIVKRIRDVLDGA